jgi:hypothetical protein
MRFLAIAHGDYDDESGILKRWAHLRLRGREWFRWDRRILSDEALLRFPVPLKRFIGGIDPPIIRIEIEPWIPNPPRIHVDPLPSPIPPSIISPAKIVPVKWHKTLVRRKGKATA